MLRKIQNYVTSLKPTYVIYVYNNNTRGLLTYRTLLMHPKKSVLSRYPVRMKGLDL